jgi:Holliday junction resolvasome RuvABC endonuclease subunit
MENKYFFGLDLSLNSTGIAVFTADDMRFVETSTIAIDKKSPLMRETKNKLKYIGTELLKYKEEYNPSFVVIEMGFMRFVKSTAQLMRVHGIVNYLFSDIPQYEIPATTIKMVLAGKGNSDKSEVAKAVLKIYPQIKFKSEDESDACATAICWGTLNKVYSKGIKHDT